MAYYSGGMSAAPMGGVGGGFSAAPMMSPGGGGYGGFVGGSPIPMQMQPVAPIGYGGFVGGSPIPMQMQPVAPIGGSAIPMPIGGSAIPMTISHTFPGPMSVAPAMVQSPGVVQFLAAPQSPLFGVPVGIGKMIINVAADSTQEQIQQSILRSLPPGSVYVGKEGALVAPPPAAPNSSMPPPPGAPPGAPAPPPPAVDRGFPGPAPPALGFQGPAPPAPGQSKFVVTLNRAVGQFVGPDGLSGVGISFAVFPDGAKSKVVIMNMTPGGPAAMSGKIMAQQELVEVNSDPVNNKSVEEITRLLKGLPNSPVTLTLSPPTQ